MDSETCNLKCLKVQPGDEQERDETRTKFLPEEEMLLREFFDLLYQINKREKIC